MQVISSGPVNETCVTNLPDRVTAGNLLSDATHLSTIHVGIERIEYRSVMSHVLQDHSISIGRIKSGVPNDSIGRRRNRRSVLSGKVDPRMIA
jgi:hypothetical protein